MDTAEACRSLVRAARHRRSRLTTASTPTRSCSASVSRTSRGTRAAPTTTRSGSSSPDTPVRARGVGRRLQLGGAGARRSADERDLRTPRDPGTSAPSARPAGRAPRDHRARRRQRGVPAQRPLGSGPRVPVASLPAACADLAGAATSSSAPRRPDAISSSSARDHERRRDLQGPAGERSGEHAVIARLQRDAIGRARDRRRAAPGRPARRRRRRGRRAPRSRARGRAAASAPRRARVSSSSARASEPLALHDVEVRDVRRRSRSRDRSTCSRAARRRRPSAQNGSRRRAPTITPPSGTYPDVMPLANVIASGSRPNRLDREPVADAPVAADHLVDDEQDAALATDTLHAWR